MKKKWLVGFFGCYAFFIALKIYSAKVDFLHFSPAFPPSFFAALTVPFHWGPMDSSDLGPAQFIFRQELGHSGYAANAQIPLEVQPHTLIESLNVGIHGASKSSPAVDDSGIYVGSDAGIFYALDFAGHVRWRYVSADSSLGIHATAALDNKNAYFGNYNGDLLALNKSTGTPAWIHRLGGTIGSSVSLYENNLIVAVETSNPANGFVVCLDRRDGNIIWKSQYLGEQSHASPTVDVALKKVFLGANNGRFFALDLTSGKTLWTYQTEGDIKSTADVVNGNVLFTSWDHYLYNLSATDGSVHWKIDLGAKSQSSPSLAKDLNTIVVGSGTGELYSIDVTTGKIHWRNKLGSENMRFPSAQIVPDSQKINEGAIAWIGCGHKDLCAVGMKSGHVLRQIHLSGFISGQPTAFKNKLFVAMQESGLAELSVNNPRQTRIEDRAHLGALSMAERVQNNGTFVYNYVENGSDVNELPEYNLLRHAGSVYSLVQAYNRFQEPTFFAAVQKLMPFLRKSLIHANSIETVACSDHSGCTLGGSALTLIAELSAEKIGINTFEKEEIKGLGNLLLRMQRDDGKFYSFYSLELGPMAIKKSLYYPGEAILALFMLAENTGEAVYGQKAVQGLTYLANVANSNKLWEPDNWTLIAIAHGMKFSPQFFDAQATQLLIAHAKKVAQVDLNDQNPTSGSFHHNDRVSPTATRLEGLLAIYPIMKKSDPALAKRIASAGEKGVQFLLNVPSSARFPGAFPDQPHRMLPSYRIDDTQHSVSALLTFLDEL